MDSEQVVVVAAASIGAALAVNVAVIAAVEVLALALEGIAEEGEEEDRQWALDRLTRLRLRSRQLRQERSMKMRGCSPKYTWDWVRYICWLLLSNPIRL
jgi:hypothetical protein